MYLCTAASTYWGPDSLLFVIQIIVSMGAGSRARSALSVVDTQHRNLTEKYFNQLMKKMRWGGGRGLPAKLQITILVAHGYQGLLSQEAYEV